jgi:cytochrome c5
VKRALWFALALVASLPAARLYAADAVDAEFPVFDDPQLARGRAVWLGTCKVCHATGFADAPSVRDKVAWQPRLAQGKVTLCRHALQGFFGPMGSMMPPRGGNERLTDEEVKSAVDYMTTIVK